MRQPYAGTFGPSTDLRTGVFLCMNGQEARLTTAQAASLAQELLRCLAEIAESNQRQVNRMLTNAYQD